MESMEVEKFGKKFTYENSFDGPVKARSCTDVSCLILLVGMMVLWIYALVHAIILGDLNLLDCLTAKNGSQYCSIQQLKDQPVFYISEVSKCHTQNLSKCGTCMTKKEFLEKCQSSPLVINTHKNETNDSETWNINTLICVDNITIANSKDNKQIENRRDYNICTLNLELTNKSSNNEAISDIAAFVKRMSFVTESFDDIKNSWIDIILFWCVAAVACLLYLIIIYFFLPIILWVSIIGLTILLLFGATLSLTKYFDYDTSVTRADFSKYVSAELWIVIFIICLVILVTLIIILIVLRKRLKMAVILITEACRALGSVTLSMIFPLFPVIFQLGFTVMLMATFMYLYTSDIPIHNKQSNNNTKESSADHNLFIVLCSINIFSYFWSICFVCATSDLILAGVFSTWYWTLDKSNVHNSEILKSTYRTFRYHLGTAAFGALVIAICKSIRILLHYISRTLQSLQSFCSIVLWPLKCIFWIIENFITYLNRNGYIMCALHGTNYFSSAKSAYQLLMRNILRVVVLSNVIAFIILLGELLVTLGVTVAAYYNFEREEQDLILNNSIIPTICVAVGSFFVAQHFFNLLEIATATIFICFLEDCERNDGSQEKPFFMSTKLREIIEKHESS